MAVELAGISEIKSLRLFDCDKLKELDASQSKLKSLLNATFYNCKELLSLTLPQSCNTIGYGAFYLCESLKNINLENVANYGECAFDGCNKLIKVSKE